MRPWQLGHAKASRPRVRSSGSGSLLALAGIEASARPCTVARGELEVPSPRPGLRESDDVGEVALDVEAVKLARGDEGEDVCGGVGVVVGAGPRRPPIFRTQ